MTMLSVARHVLGSVVLLCVASSAVADNIEAAGHQLRFSEESLNVQVHNKSRLPFNADSYIVVLDELSTLAFETTLENSGLDVANASTTSPLSRDPVFEQFGRIEQQQISVIAAAQARLPTATVSDQFTDIVNAVVIRAKDPQAKSILESIAGVSYVVPNDIVRKHMDASLPIIKAPEAWELVGGRSEAGKGIKVAIIDSGIVPEHPMFDGSSFEQPTDLPDDDYCSTDPEFCNGKLIVARHYTPDDLDASEVDTPYDIDGHGTHVAGTAVGNTVLTSDGTELSGVAPGAYLMVYKALWADGSGSASGSTSGLVRALQDAVSDGADVINNSWGSDASLGAFRFYNDVFSTLEAAGVMLVTSAGNSGPSAETMGCPACAKPGLAVASTDTQESSESNSVIRYGDLSLNSVPGADVINNTDTTATALPAESLADANTDACAAYSADSFDGSIGIVYRGGETPDGGPCYFYIKATNLKNAGAVGMIVINNRPGDAITMGGLTDLLFPSVMISQEQGRELLAAYQPGAPITIGTFSTRVVPVNAISDFSSRGPNVDAEVLKPDIAAPGSLILSAGLGSESSSYIALSGTSMASPHVAGAAAVVLQNAPDLTPKQLKSTLMNAANPSASLDAANSAAASVFASGAGMLDLPNAMANQVFFDNVSIASYCVSTCTYSVSGENTGLDTLSFDLSLEFNSSYATVDLQDTIDLSGQETFELSFTADVSAAESGWLTGRLLFNSRTESAPSLAVPISIFVGSQEDESILNLSGTVASGIPSELTAEVAGAPSADNNALYSMTIKNPDNLTLVASSVTETVSNVSGNTLTTDADSGTISWSGKLNALDGSIDASSFFATGLSLENDYPNSITNTLDCDDLTERPDGCDELNWTFFVENLGISIAGETIQRLQITPNGLAVFNPSDADTSAATYTPASIPSATLPNNILAPFWTDLVLGGDGSVSDLQVGEVLNENEQWWVVEWFNAREYGTTGPTYTFSLWMKENSSDIYFNYASVPATPSLLSIGVEDSSGASGISLYSGGQGALPETASSYQSDITSFQGSATIAYNVDSEVLATVEDSEVMAPANGSLDLSLSELVSVNTSSGTVVAQLDVDGKRYESTVSHVSPAGNLLYTIVSNPTQGEVAVRGGQVISDTGHFTYTPNRAFVGQDSFTFRVVDSANTVSKSSEATVLITVEDTGIDTDGDGLSDQQEYDLGSDPFDSDSDDDGLNDGREVELGTDPNKADSDGDGFTDGDEVAAGTDPNNADSIPSATEENGGLPIWALFIASEQSSAGNSGGDDKPEPDTK